MHSYTGLYIAIQGYTELCTAIQSHTLLNRAIHGYTEMCKNAGMEEIRVPVAILLNVCDRNRLSIAVTIQFASDLFVPERRT